MHRLYTCLHRPVPSEAAASARRVPRAAVHRHQWSTLPLTEVHLCSQDRTRPCTENERSHLQDYPFPFSGSFPDLCGNLKKKKLYTQCGAPSDNPKIKSHAPLSRARQVPLRWTLLMPAGLPSSPSAEQVNTALGSNPTLEVRTCRQTFPGL